MRLILVRHGETEHNRDQITLGRADVPLTERGRAQAAAVAATFTRPPAAIFTSPLSRAADTAAAIAATTSVGAVIDESLTEMDVGDLEHLTTHDLRARYPEFVAEWLSPAAGDARMPGGETLREVQDRAWTAIERMRSAHPDAEVVAVTHNFVILTVVCRALDLPLGQFRRLRQALAARTVIDVRQGACTLLQLNDTAHLLAAGLADDLSGREARS